MYSMGDDKLQPPDLSNVPVMADYEDFINKIHKRYSKYIKYHKKNETHVDPTKPLKKIDAISAVNKIPEEYFAENFKIRTDFFKLK